ncbi:alcohol dehydrogenase [Cadophora sp. DSE1049]|nr:alcohol dehydrogenase [Cadophora sp. DSE1049]
MSFPIPKTHKAMVYDKPGSLSLKLIDVDTPEPSFGELLVRLTHSGVCHSDFGIMTTAWSWLPRPCQSDQVGGHEGVGMVVKLGPGVKHTGTVKVGDRVGIKWISKICRQCEACLAGSDACCLKSKISGYYTPGTFQQYTLAPADYVTMIPDGVASDAAAPLLCGGVTSYAALKKTGAIPGDWVIISGAGGGVGHLACQIGSRAMGFRILGIDANDKEILVRECGAEEFLGLNDDSQTKESIPDAVKRITGGLGAVAVIVANGSNTAYSQGLECLRFNGTLVAVGCQEGPPVAIATATPNMFLFTQLRIIGSAVGNQKDAIEVMNLANRGVISARRRIDKMENLMDIFESMHNNKALGKTVIKIP